jgi:hypothetical protein
MLSMSLLSLCAYASTAELRYFERGILTDGTNTAYYIIDKDNKTLYITGDGVTNARTPDYPNADSGPFAGRTDITKIVIEENVERVGDYVCSNLKKVDTLEIQSNLLSSDSNMSSKAMIGCTSLRNIQADSSLISTNVLLELIKGALDIASGNWLSVISHGISIGQTGVNGDGSLSNEAVHAMVNDYIMTEEEIFLGDLDEAIALCQAREQEICYWDNAYHHQYESHISVQPSCTAGGEMMHTCAVCGSFYVEPYGDPIGHNYAYETLYEPSCTKEGISKGVCANCGDISFVSIPAKGHTEGKWVTIKLPTMTEKGTIQCNCADCGEFIRKVDVSISKSTYFKYKVGIDPTANTAAEVAAQHEAAGYASTAVKNKAIMADTDPVGTGCEIYVSYAARYAVTEIYTVVLYGDVNGDGLINDADYELLAGQISGADAPFENNSVYKRAADMNGDGTVDGFDLALLDLQISGDRALDQTRPQY